MSEPNEARIYVNLRPDGMFVSRATAASRSFGLCGGDLVLAEAEQAPITIEYCQLSPAQFLAHRLAQGLDPEAYAERYGLKLKAVLRYEGISATAT